VNFRNGISVRGAKANERHPGRGEHRVDKRVTSPSAGLFVGAVVQFDGHDNQRRVGINEHEIEMLLRYGTERAAVVTRHGTRYHVSESHLAHDEIIVPDCDAKRSKESSFAFGKQSPAPAIDPWVWASP